MIRDINDRLKFMFTHGERLKDDLWDEIESWWKREEHTYYDISSLQGYEHLPELFDKEDSSEKVMELFEQGQIALWLQENDLFEIVPVGLTMEQIKQYNPPHNPAKITDPRAKGYIKKYGAISWEVDALRPEVMIKIVKGAIEENIDMRVPFLASDYLDMSANYPNNYLHKKTESKPNKLAKKTTKAPPKPKFI